MDIYLRVTASDRNSSGFIDREVLKRKYRSFLLDNLPRLRELAEPKPVGFLVFESQLRAPIRDFLISTLQKYIASGNVAYAIKHRFPDLEQSVTEIKKWIDKNSDSDTKSDSIFISKAGSGIKLRMALS